MMSILLFGGESVRCLQLTEIDATLSVFVLNMNDRCLLKCFRDTLCTLEPYKFVNFMFLDHLKLFLYLTVYERYDM